MSGPPAARPTICLCMIVRDEVDVLAECLRSARPLIDRWVICDTGSSDGTQDLIRRELADVPGELHEHEWVDFAHNRTELMRLAHGKADYLLILDADTTIVCDPARLADLDADAYVLSQVEGHVRYQTTRLVSGRVPWRYVGVVHEYITSDEAQTTGRLEDVVIRSRSIGAVRHGRWRRDAEALEAAVAANPDDARSIFYLAQTYRDIGLHEGDEDALRSALARYEQRAAMGGGGEEVYYALYQAGAMRERLGDWPGAVEAYKSAWQTRPSRLEAVHDLTVGLTARGEYAEAHQYASLAAGPDPLPVPDDVIYVSLAVYEWGMLLQYTNTAYRCGELDNALAACRRLLEVESLPAPQREWAQGFLSFGQRERARQSGPRLVVRGPGT